ncbi:MAG: nucleotidyltransferase domain-containing protein, partial [Defluviitaleaceae bacterium]|nr:nucleotidyltransferase domain-containing protein [Defluviitaleaceae bacterium]
MQYNPFDNPTVCIISKSVYNAAKNVLGDNLHKVYLYGSYARGDYDHESDIDYMVIANLPHKEACDK